MRYSQYLRATFLTLVAAGFLLTHCHASSSATTAQDRATPKSNTEMKAMSLSPEQRGDLLMIRHQYLDAIDAYRSAPRDSAVRWNKLGIAYHHMFAFDQAKIDYEWALHLNPKYGEAMNNLAAIYYSEKDYKHAIKLYRRSLKIIPNSAVAYSNLGAAYFAAGRNKEGVAAYQAAFTIDPKVFSGDQLEAVSEISSNEERARLNYCLAELYARAGMKEQAIEYLRKALDAGFSDTKRLMQDEEFASIRQSAEFVQVVATAKRP